MNQKKILETVMEQDLINRNQMVRVGVGSDESDVVRKYPKQSLNYADFPDSCWTTPNPMAFVIGSVGKSYIARVLTRQRMKMWGKWEDTNNSDQKGSEKNRILNV